MDKGSRTKTRNYLTTNINYGRKLHAVHDAAHGESTIYMTLWTMESSVKFAEDFFYF